MSRIIPNEILQKLKLSKAKVELIGKSLYSITNINFGDKAWNIYKDWINEKYKDGDIKIGAGFFPTLEIKNSDNCPIHQPYTMLHILYKTLIY